MGFKDVKRRVLESTASGNYQHTARDDIDAKNLMQTGDVSPAEVAEVIKRCREHDHDDRLQRAMSISELKAARRTEP